jgi:hypothetical protein
MIIITTAPQQEAATQLSNRLGSAQRCLVTELQQQLDNSVVYGYHSLYNAA